MNNKVLINLIVPEIDETYDIFLPVNEQIWKIKKLLVKSVNDLSGSTINDAAEYELLNKSTSQTYDDNALVIDTNIRNGTELYIIKKD